MGFLSGVTSLINSQVNKFRPGEEENREGVLDLFEKFSLKMPDDDLIRLKKEWEKKWQEYEPQIRQKQQDNENYWLGLHYGGSDNRYYGGSFGDYNNEAPQASRPMVDNLIFEALETFLPLATQRNPEPTVNSINTEEAQKLSRNVQRMLAYHADRLRLKLRLKRVCRFWALYLLGVAKVGWSEKENDITIQIIRPQKLILDPNGTINDDMEYTGQYIGEYKQGSFEELEERFPNKKNEILDLVHKKKGSTLGYIEWWTNDFVFWTMDDVVLGKAKNPHWNEQEDTTEIDEYGEETKSIKPGRNHFPVKKMPYIFMSVFNLGKHPHDDTSLIGQNLVNQDIVNKRQRQIDRNIDGMNGGWFISGDSGLTKEEATELVHELRKGGAGYLSEGNPNSVIARIVGSGLPGDVFNNMADTRNEMRSIFGVSGSTAQGIANENTVRGKIIVRDQDTSRIGGGISEYLEQFADQVFNWFVQLMMVYYDEEHVAAIIGEEKTPDTIALIKDDFEYKLTVSVKEGSLIPKDSLTEANQAIDLTTAGLMDPITMFDKLDFPDPKGAAEQLFKWQQAPQTLFTEAAVETRAENEAQQMEQAALQMQIQVPEAAQPQDQMPLPPVQ